jgi:hypothetical protein
MIVKIILVLMALVAMLALTTGAQRDGSGPSLKPLRSSDMGGGWAGLH